MIQYKKYAFLLGLTLMMAACKDEPKTEEQPAITKPVEMTPLIPHTVTNKYPHDTTLFTEGFLFHKGQLFESTGSPENLPELRSVVGISNLGNGKFQKKIEIDKTKYFGEGIVILDGKLYQLTYKNQQGFIYDLATFKQLGTFPFANAEGWGMTTNGKELIMSDGTDELTFLNPADMKPVKTLKVIDAGVSLPYLNELEYIKGYIYANVWMTNFIVKIDPASGKVIGRLDLAPLSYEARTKNPSADVLNGIAYDETTDKIYVTGKLWPNIYEINFVH